MPIITAIKPQKGRGRVNVYLDNKFGFGIDYENYVKYKLKVEAELSSNELEKIKGDADFQKILSKILDFASRRPRSGYEYKLWLKRKNVPENFHKRLFSQLKQYNLFDDEAFASWWVGERQLFHPKAKRILNYELRTKGIDKEIIQKVLSEAEIDEEKIARDLIIQMQYKWKNLKELDRKKKKSEFLVRKGFSWDVVKAVVDTRDLEGPND